MTESNVPKEEVTLKPRGKPCTCDNCLGSSCACLVDAGESLGVLWYCQKRAKGGRQTTETMEVSAVELDGMREDNRALRAALDAFNDMDVECHSCGWSLQFGIYWTHKCSRCLPIRNYFAGVRLAGK